jgi:hypothetical protein
MQEKRGRTMNSSEKHPIMINLVQGTYGAEFDSSDRYCQLNAMMGLFSLKSGEEKWFFGLFP